MQSNSNNDVVFWCIWKCIEYNECKNIFSLEIQVIIMCSVENQIFVIIFKICLFTFDLIVSFYVNDCSHFEKLIQTISCSNVYMFRHSCSFCLSNMKNLAR